VLHGGRERRRERVLVRRANEGRPLPGGRFPGLARVTDGVIKAEQMSSRDGVVSVREHRASPCSRRRRFARIVALAGAVVVVALSVGATSAQAAYLEQIASTLRQRSPGTEGNVWWLRDGNTLLAPSGDQPGWLRQTVDCWGSSSCSKPPPGGAAFLKKVTEMVSIARKSVDITHLYQLKLGGPGYPDGAYLDAIVDGLNQGHKDHPKDIPLVRLLIGVYPPGSADEQAFIDKLQSKVGNWVKVQSGSMRTAPTSWNHTKVLDVDSKEAIVGGMNYWSSDYLATSHPTNDISAWVKGPVSADVTRFTNVLWKFTCDRRLVPFNGITVRMYHTGGCIDNVGTDAPAPDPKGVPIMVVGKLGYNIDVPGHAGWESASIDRPKLSGNTCNTQQQKDDNKDVNTKRDYEYRNPGETALRALLATAKKSIFISQQDLLSCLPGRSIASEAEFDERVFATLARKIHEGIPITIVLSNPGGDYSNGWDPKDVAYVLWSMLEKNEGLDHAAAEKALCQDVGLTTIRNNSKSATWQDGKRFYNHAKLVAVDDQAFYIGSGNLYPSALQELGMIVEDSTAGAQLKSAYLDPLWENSRFPGGVIDPQSGICAI
jgi:phosphatidylserine/phosphatidylglycerophosphate/cardiolipin synthase-like enzyme